MTGRGSGDLVLWLVPGMSLRSAGHSTVMRSAGRQVSLIKSPALAGLVADLGGTVHGPAPLTATGSPQANATVVADDLVARGIAILAGADTLPVHLSIADRCGVEPAGLAVAADLLASRSVQLRQLDRTLPDIGGLLSSTGIRVSDEDFGGDASLVVVACGDLLDEAALENLRQLWDAGRTFLAASFRGRCLSPVFSPGSSVCPACVSATVRANRPWHVLAEGSTGIRPASVMTHAGWDHLLVVAATASLVAGQLLDLRHQESHASCATVLASDGTPRRIPMFSRPGCPECDTPSQLAVDSVDEVLGLIRSIEVTAVGEDLWVARAEHALMTAEFIGGSAVAADHAYRARSEGKGRSAQAAIDNAAAEAVERICAVMHPGVPVTSSRGADLDVPALFPPDLAHYSAGQYERRRAENLAHSAHNRVPPPWDPDTAMLWTPAAPLGGGDPVLVPCAYAFTDADEFLGVPGPLRSVVASSNGCASSASVQDACLLGMLELIERDAVAIWWYNQLRMPGVGRGVLRRTVVSRVRRVLLGRDRLLHVLDLTHDLGVPVCAAVCPLRTPGVTGSSEIIVGFGAGLTLGEAADRACLEALQFLPMLDALPGGDQRFSRHAPDSRQWWGSVRAADESWLVPDDSAAPVSRRDLRGLDDLMEALGASGLSAYWVNQTQRRFAVPVVRVIVPGLRHFWRQLGPGRLYDVPVTCGRRSDSLAEQDLNPLSVFF